MSNPFVWQMIKAVCDKESRELTYTEIKEAILKDYPDTNETTITCQIIVCCVNHPSRIHYPENKKPRKCISQYDFLYYDRRGVVSPYDPQKHGNWEIVINESGKPEPRRIDEDVIPPAQPAEDAFQFALESHLRDFLEKHIEDHLDFGERLKVYIDPSGTDGIEYYTDVGLIDILTVNEKGDFCVFELKLGRGEDAALGQILRYMGWVKEKLAGDKEVRGIILAARITDKLKYAVTQVKNVQLLEYELHFDLKEPKKI